MEQVRDAINLIWKLSVGAELVVAIRLLAQGLGGKYPALVVASVVFPIKSLMLMFWYTSHLSQAQMRQVAGNLGPLDGLLGAWIVFELFSRWTTSYEGIGRFGKALLVVLLSFSIGISVLWWNQEWQALDFVKDFRIYYILHRVVQLTLGLFALGTWLFFRKFKEAMAPNIVRHTYVAIFYFMGNGIAELAFTLSGKKYVPVINLAIVSITGISYAAWAWVMTRKGQIVPEQELVNPLERARLERLNADLLVAMGAGPKRQG